MQIGERLPDGRLGGIFVADSREEGIDLIYYAKTGAIVDRGDKKVLLMNDGVIHRKTPAGDVSVIRFTSYAFDLSAFASATGEITLLPKDQTTPYLLNPDPNDTIFKQIAAVVTGPNSTSASPNGSIPIVFALIALAVAGDARSHREARIHPLITAIAICAVRALARLLRRPGEAESVAAFRLSDLRRSRSWHRWSRSGSSRTNRTMELPVTWVDAGMSLGRRIGDGWTACRLRLGGRAPPAGSGMMGWTLGRYFFFRYVTITVWFFLGIFALIFLIDFTELSGRTAGLPGFTYRDGAC